MEYYVECKIRGDSFGPGFSAGLTLTEGGTMEQFSVSEQREDCTVYTDSRGYRLEAWHIPAGNAVECRSVFVNESDTPVILELLTSFALQGLHADRMHRVQSFWSAEGRLLSQDLVDLNLEPSWAGFGIRTEKFGQIGSMPVRKWFPFCVLENTETGEFTGVQLYCASSWQIELFRSQEPLHLCGGLADWEFGHWYKEIKPGERFETPKAMVARGSSLEEVCDRLVKAQRPRIAPIDRDMPVIFNEFCTTWGNPTLENLEKTACRLEGSSIRYLVIDAGWYKVPEADWSTTHGDWNPSKELFPNGISEATEMIRSHGLIPGIWFEMETTAENAEAYQLTDHLLKRDGFVINVGKRRFWDMEDPWVQDYLSRKVIGLLRENDFGYVKIDYNDAIGVGCPSYKKQMFFSRRSVLTQEYMGLDENGDDNVVFPLDQPSNEGNTGPNSIHHRYLTEDVPIGCNNLHDLGVQYGVPTPIIDSMITLAGAMHNKNFYETSRYNLQYLGIDSMSKEELLAYLNDGTYLR